MFRLDRVCVVLLWLAVAAPAQSAPAGTPPATHKPAAPAAAHRAGPGSAVAERLPSEETVNAFLKKMFGYEAAVSWKVVEIKPSPAPRLAEVSVMLSSPQGQPQVSKLYVTADGQHAIVGELIPFGSDPFASARTELERGANGVARGPVNAPVTIVEFSDLQCPHCKQAQPIIDKLLAEEPNARFVFQNFPLPSHNWARKAASYADCIGRENKDAFWKFVHEVYDNQEQITESNGDEKLKQYTTAAGANAATAAACAASPATATRVQSSINLGQRLDVTGTPTLFVGGRKISNVSGVPFDALKKMVEFQAQPK